MEFCQGVVHCDHSFFSAGLDCGFDLGNLVFSDQIGYSRCVDQHFSGRYPSLFLFWNQPLGDYSLESY